MKQKMEPSFRLVAAEGVHQYLSPLEDFIRQVESRQAFRKISGASREEDGMNDRYDTLLLSVLISLKKAVPFHEFAVAGENQEFLGDILNLEAFLKEQDENPSMSELHLRRAAKSEMPHLQAYLSVILPKRPVIEIPEHEL